MAALAKTPIDDLVKNAWEAEDFGALYMAEAQVRATLALVEQQRIANLIELTKVGHIKIDGLDELREGASAEVWEGLNLA